MNQPKTEQKLFVFEFEEYIFQLILLTVQCAQAHDSNIHIWNIFLYHTHTYLKW